MGSLLEGCSDIVIKLEVHLVTDVTGDSCLLITFLTMILISRMNPLIVMKILKTWLHMEEEPILQVGGCA